MKNLNNTKQQEDLSVPQRQDKDIPRLIYCLHCKDESLCYPIGIPGGFECDECAALVFTHDD